MILNEKTAEQEIAEELQWISEPHIGCGSSDRNQDILLSAERHGVSYVFRGINFTQGAR